MEVVITANHPKASCVDLRASFPGVYRFAWDEAYQAEQPRFRTVEAPWLTIIPGTHGKIFPWGGRMLAAYSSAGGTKRRELEALEGVTRVQGGSEGEYRDMVVTFDVGRIEAVASVLGSKVPRKRLSPDQRATQIERLRAYRFARKADAGK